MTVSVTLNLIVSVLLIVTGRVVRCEFGLVIRISVLMELMSSWVRRSNLTMSFIYFLSSDFESQDMTRSSAYAAMKYLSGDFDINLDTPLTIRSKYMINSVLLIVQPCLIPNDCFCMVDGDELTLL